MVYKALQGDDSLEVWLMTQSTKRVMVCKEFTGQLSV
jgi:hypothetical protein